MKKILKNPIFMFVLGALIFSGITGVVAANLASEKVSYDNGISNSNKTNVQDAIDDLYDKAKHESTLTLTSDQISTLDMGENHDYRYVDPTALVPSGEKSITENGIYDVSGFASAVVNTPTGPSNYQKIYTGYRSLRNTSTAQNVTVDSGTITIEHDGIIICSLEGSGWSINGMYFYINGATQTANNQDSAPTNMEKAKVFVYPVKAGDTVRGYTSVYCKGGDVDATQTAHVAMILVY